MTMRYAGVDSGCVEATTRRGEALARCKEPRLQYQFAVRVSCGTRQILSLFNASTQGSFSAPAIWPHYTAISLLGGKYQPLSSSRRLSVEIAATHIRTSPLVPNACQLFRVQFSAVATWHLGNLAWA